MLAKTDQHLILIQDGAFERPFDRAQDVAWTLKLVSGFGKLTLGATAAGDLWGKHQVGSLDRTPPL
ncbi:MAG: hypothetical protein MAG451_02488 [Anaerolineales bacterium]|nr:hypothetical protein [Anaerolineales bacterium]